MDNISRDIGRLREEMDRGLPVLNHVTEASMRISDAEISMRVPLGIMAMEVKHSISARHPMEDSMIFLGLIR